MNRKNIISFAVLAVVMVAVAAFLRSHYAITASSDPAIWYQTGLSFTETYGSAKLAYFFPMMVWIASKLTSPLSAYLVNLPVVFALVFIVRTLAHRAAGTGGSAPAFAGLAAIFLIFWVDADRLLSLCNAYRDAPSYVLLGLSIIALIDFRRDPEHRLWRVALSGAALAFAVSARETSAIALPALALYAIVARLRDRSLPFLKPMLVFIAAGLVCAIPLLVQNMLVSGNALTPAQASHERPTTTFFYGLSTEMLTHTLPEVLGHLQRNLGWPLLGGALLAVLALARLPGSAERICLLALPALIHMIFYGAYIRAVARYLFSVDVFIIPLVAAGIGVLLDTLLRFRPFARRRVLADGILMVALALATILLLRSIPPVHPRLTLSKIGAFQKHLDQLLPPGSAVLGERPIGDYLRAFAPRRADVIDFITPRASRMDPAWGDALHRIATDHERLFYAGRPGPELTSVQTQFDVRPFATIAPGTFGMRKAVGDDFHLYELVPWSTNTTEVTVTAPPGDDVLLTLGLGALSRQARDRCELSVNGALIDSSPADGYSTYRIRQPATTPTLHVLLSSDRPVPASITAKVQSASDPYILTLRGEALVVNAARLSDDFLKFPRNFFLPTTTSGRGWLDLPTPAGPPAYDVVLDLVLTPSQSGHREMNVVVSSGEQTARVVVTEKVAPISLRLPVPPLAGNKTTSRLSFEVTPVPGQKSGWLSILRATVKPSAVPATGTSLP